MTYVRARADVGAVLYVLLHVFCCKYSQDLPECSGAGGGERVGAAICRARVVAGRGGRVPRVPGRVVAVEETQV